MKNLEREKAKAVDSVLAFIEKYGIADYKLLKKGIEAKWEKTFKKYNIPDAEIYPNELELVDGDQTEITDTDMLLGESVRRFKESNLVMISECDHGYKGPNKHDRSCKLYCGMKREDYESSKS